MDRVRKLSSFEQRLMPHLNAAYNLARWLTKDGPDAEDIVQESYLRAFRAFDSFAGSTEEEARGWLLTIVRNTSFTMLKKRGIAGQIEFDEQLHSEETADPESILLNESAMTNLNGCIEALPAEFREVVVLREIEELSYKEISGVSRVPVGTVMSRLARARRRLADCMKGLGV